MFMITLVMIWIIPFINDIGNLCIVLWLRRLPVYTIAHFTNP